MQKIAIILGVMLMIAHPVLAQAELIILAAPVITQDDEDSDNYYEDVIEDIIRFQADFARKIVKNGDDVLVLVGERDMEFYHQHIDKKHLLPVGMADIWMRDFTVVNPAEPVMFRYSAAGQGGMQDEADVVQDIFATFLENTGLPFEETDLINDGGNFVDDGHGNLVVSRKFLRDNNLNETQAREALRDITYVKNIAFIEADEQGGLEHADGVVSFVEKNTLIINSYPHDPDYATQLKADLIKGLPGIKIIEITTPYDDSTIYDERFGSACGLYTNALVTPDRIYLPQFGVPQDSIAIQQVQSATNRQIIPVLSQGVCPMGGGVRCMSLQLRGEAAKTVLNFARQFQANIE